MLRELHVRGLGPLREVSVDFAPGLNVVTGETGAGKTLLVTSLALLCGARGESRLVGHGADEAVIQAVVDVPEHIRPVLEDLGVAADDELVCARRVGADGRSRAWLGGRLVPIGTLGEVCQALVEIHGQGAGFALATPGVQLDAIDVLADVGDLVAAYRTALRCVRDVAAERERLASADGQREREVELLVHQADEVERVAPQPGEDARLGREIARGEHAEQLQVLCRAATDLVGPDGAAGQLAEARRTLEDAAALDPGLADVAARIAGLAAEATDAASDLRLRSESFESDPVHLERLRERAAVLAALKRKHGVGLDDLVRRASDARRRAAELGGSAERVVELDKTLATVRAELSGLARDLTERRRGAADRLTKLVASELPALALPSAVFRAECTDKGAYGDRGKDDVRFLFASDRRLDLHPIGKVASGGELSRTMIAVTLALARAHRISTLVFDEADQGVGGEAALELARRLRRLGGTHQVLVVSHLPQLAAFADRHVLVAKGPAGPRTQALSGQRRLAEISRMLAGLSSSDRARAHARELIDLAASEVAQRSSLVG